ncbi:PREDICTED: organic cation transporter protein isoform X1 [Papilio xuthus]|uniref:Organic cation transporter protein isoform X1 n=2 Tax=Papilio xuthus TaxID=66420 RepID=A0AAJ6ZNA9_PAPXU|nr:PREDICTED: organic cation transporter protein isoform X1 [Papilio xuthus]
MAPQERTSCCEQEDDSRQNAGIDNNLSNIDLSGTFLNKAFTHDSTDNTSNTTNKISDSANNNGNANVKKPTDFDDLLPYVGEFGLYQKMLFLLMIPFAFFVAFVYFSQIFMTIVPEQHWCWVPELANLTVEERRALAIPPKSGGPYSHDRCRMYSADWAAALAQGRTTPDDEWPTIPCAHGWEYNKSDVPYDTIASELDWVCEKDNLPATAQAIFFCGAIVGGLVFGWIADKYGRIPALVGTNLIGFTAGVGTAFCSTFWSFALCRFLVGLAFDNCFTMMYILVLEYVGPKWRTFVANMSIALFFTLAASLLPWIALLADDWRLFAAVTSAPFILALATPWVVPESARWLVSQGKIDKALIIMKKFERINKTKIPDKVLNEFTESSLKTIKESEAESRSYSVLDLFKTPRLRKNAILLIIIWMAISLVFDGHVRNVGSLGLDIFLTFTIASATELPADTFLTAVLDRWGRRWLACGSMVISGIFSLLATAVPVGGPSASLAIMGRFAVNISYNIGLQYAAELLPTVVRAQGVALIHIMGYVASIVAPFVVYLANISQDLPLLILGVLGVMGGLLCLFLPETMDTEMPQTLQDGENFGKDQKFWDNPCFSRKTVDNESPERYTKRASVAHEEPQFVRALPSAISSRASIRASVRASARGSLRKREVSRKREVV